MRYSVRGTTPRRSAASVVPNQRMASVIAGDVTTSLLLLSFAIFSMQAAEDVEQGFGHRAQKRGLAMPPDVTVAPDRPSLAPANGARTGGGATTTATGLALKR